VTCSHDKTLKLWDVATFACTRILSGHTAPVRFCYGASSGKLFVSASYDGVVKLWELDTCLSSRTSHEGKVHGCSFAADCSTVVSCGDDMTVRLYSVPDMAEGLVLRGHKDKVFTTAFGPDNETLASGGFDNTLKLWNWKTGQQLHSWAMQACVFSCDFGPRGFLSACGDDMAISIFHVNSQKLVATLVGHTARAASCDFHPHKLEILSASHDTTIRIWDQNNAMKDFGYSDMQIQMFWESGIRGLTSTVANVHWEKYHMEDTSMSSAPMYKTSQGEDRASEATRIPSELQEDIQELQYLAAQERRTALTAPSVPPNHKPAARPTASETEVEKADPLSHFFVDQCLGDYSEDIVSEFGIADLADLEFLEMADLLAMGVPKKTAKRAIAATKRIVER